MRGILIILSIILLISTISAIEVTGETITGKPLQYVGLNITIFAPPALSITSPRNETYFVNTSVPLNYSTVGGIDTIWYNLDLGSNITITSPIYFSIAEGIHIIYLYANNSEGTTVKSISFSVNSTKLKIIADKWKGNSTNFTIFSYEEIQNLSNVILEESNYGKILFNQNINLTADFNSNDNQIDLNSTINISFNRIEMNSTALPNFNISATLSLYNLGFSNPRILRDEVICPSSICTKESYLGNILIFNVTDFSVYSSEETPVTTPTTPKASEGGGGGGLFSFLIPGVKSFSIDPNEIKINTIAGKVITKKITIKNNLNKKIDITLTEKDLEDFLVLKENKISLVPNESKEIYLDFMVREGTLPNLYLGKLILTRDNNEQQEILVIMEVESEGALLDVNAEIQSEYLKVSPNNDILVKISLFNVKGEGGKRDISIEYIIKNQEGNQISEDKETIAVETQTSWIKRFRIPSGTKYGGYILYVKATTQEGKIASASDTFEVVLLKDLKIILLIIPGIIIVGGLIIYFIIGRKGRREKRIKRLIKEAVSELDKEIERIRKNKSNLSSDFKNLHQHIGNDRQLEKRMRTKIMGLQNQEKDLVEKKKSLKWERGSFSERLDKVRAIKQGLSKI